MSTAIWGEPESQPEQDIPTALLRHLLQQMVAQFGCTGACIALYDNEFDHMEVRLHLRLSNARVSTTGFTGFPRGVASTENGATLDRNITVNLGDPSISAIGRLKRPSQTLAMDEFELVTAQQNDLFPVGATYRRGQDIIGYVWHKNETHIMRHEDYLSYFYTGSQ